MITYIIYNTFINILEGIMYGATWPRVFMRRGAALFTRLRQTASGNSPCMNARMALPGFRVFLGQVSKAAISNALGHALFSSPKGVPLNNLRWIWSASQVPGSRCLDLGRQRVLLPVPAGVYLFPNPRQRFALRIWPGTIQVSRSR